MTELKITIAGEVFPARLEMEKAPATCGSFLSRLPFAERVIHVRWSGQGVWMPLGDMNFDVPFENATSYPSPGEIILYPGGVSETEILLAYGRVNFASMAGQLAGNHFLTIIEGQERLINIGTKVLWEGAQSIAFERI
ncbi:DUF3830 family protein [Phyllobacterium sp. 0TCS1.6C]|uniref:DUF3830 family protein n=1 Tax=unclassified Phyllobacterium TaxID=2638441 RepID=UPI0021114B6F|nr:MULTISPECIES: DUF3830 family protein [unclassified Phyllobacterium]MCX8281113.1 DUF3830 family protein [Phyllobacterium sp. 0TCS1.6C]MCX8294600.1 DUF3830 family protein [Phyllobacterium sp. 0TCS1.6A]